MSEKTYRLLGADGQEHESTTPGVLGGNAKHKIYGRLDCGSARDSIGKYGESYTKHRVFFASEGAAIGAGYRPCGNCLRARYVEWKQRQASPRLEAKD
jgi:hypothetical protein